MLPESLIQTEGFSPDALCLDGIWQLVDEHGEYAVDITLPGDVHSALISAGVLADVYVGCNELGARWVADRDWIASRSFEWPGVAGPGDTTAAALHEWFLDIASLDTVATVRVNQQVVLDVRNAFRRYRPDVSTLLQPGSNTISIHFHSSLRTARKLNQQLPFPVPHMAENSPLAHGNLLRKVQCDFGWDWNIALAPCGLYESLQLVPMQQLRIDSMQVVQRHSGQEVSLHIRLQVYALVVFEGQLQLAIDSNLTQHAVKLNPGVSELELVETIREPELWWPAGLGEQRLYRLRVQLAEAAIEQHIGLRQIEWIINADHFGMQVNGIDVFARGANWIPVDALPSRINEDNTRQLIEAAVAANMNMLRVWGGGRYESDAFYHACDELGVLVWQDFMFACNLYPSTPEFLAEVEQEVTWQVQRLSHHACIALWCGDNELIGALGWFDESRRDRDRYLVSYDRLNRTIESALKAVEPSANWWPSSPSRGFLDFGDAWHQDGAGGDMHFWSVWHEGRDFSHYRDVRPAFCSEFGFQSFPPLQTLREFAGADELVMNSRVMESHQKNAGGNARIVETLSRYFRFPKNFTALVYLSQVQQALAMRTAVDFWRSLKPRCMGTLYWQLNDTWPVVSWSSLAHGGSWKVLHYAARRFYQPVRVVLVPETTATGTATMAVYLLNDTVFKVNADVEITLVSVTGQVLDTVILQGTGNPGRSVQIGNLRDEWLSPEHVVEFKWQASDGTSGREHIVSDTYKHLELQDSQVQLEAVPEPSCWRVTVTAQSLALCVVIEADLPGVFSDNLIDLRPGERRELEFRPTDKAAADTPPGFTICDLFSASNNSRKR